MRPATEDARRTPVTVQTLAQRKASGVPIVMVTAYDVASARAVEQSDAVDLVLAGDTAAEMVLGHRGTTAVTLDEVVAITAAVRRGLRTPLLVGDLPFGAYERSDAQAVTNAQRLVAEGGADVVKLERGAASVARASAIVQAGVPVIGHLGLTPQTETALGGRRAQGRSAEAAARLLADARALQDAGCSAIVLEAVAARVAEQVTAHIGAPTIGIGAGPGTDGQVLVWHDLMGMYEWQPRFAAAFVQLRPVLIDGLARYEAEVRAGRFSAPTPDR